MRILGKIVAWLALVALGAVIIIYAGSAWAIGRTYAAPLPQIAADRSAPGIAEGARLAKIYGCRDCHGDNGQGRVLFDAPPARMVAAPIARVIAAYSDAEFARLIRHNVKRDGTSTFIMPANGQIHIADADIARLMGWARTLKPSPADTAVETSYRPLGRALLLAGAISPSARLDAGAPPVRPVDPGRYFAASVCGGCHSLHAPDKAHDDGRPVPPLAAASAAYDDAAFARLLRTGVGMTPRDLSLMRVVAKEGLGQLADAEIAAMHAYLKREAAKPPPQ